MKNIGHLVVLVAIVGSIPVQAAPDTGLQLHNTGIGTRETGVGVTIGVRIKLGSDRVVKQSERIHLGISAGQVMVLPDGTANNGVLRKQASLAGINFRPGYSTSLNFAGKPILTEYTRLGAADKEKDDDAKQSTGDKIGWVAAVAGGVMVALIIGYVASCGPGEDNSCGSD